MTAAAPRALGGALVVGLLAAFAAPAAALVHDELRVEGRILRALPADLDGDGLRDLLVVHAEGRGRAARRSASLFWQRRPHGFTVQPDLTWELPESEVALDVLASRAGGRAAEELYALRRDGLYRYRADRARGTATAERVVAADFATLAAEVEDVLVTDFAQRWSDGEPAFLVPTVIEPTLLRRCAGGYRAISLPVPAVASYTPGGGEARGAGTELVARYRLLQPRPADQDGDGSLELVAYRQERVLRVELPSADDCAAGASLAGRYPVEIYEQPVARAERLEQIPRLSDLDGDGRLDLVVAVFREGGLFELVGRILVFRGRDDGSFPAQPDQSLIVEHGQYYLTVLRDLDGDGRLELLVPSSRIGVFGFIKLLTRHRVSFRLNAFALAPSGRFGAAREALPSTNALVSDSYDLSAIAFGDVTGDGVLDLLMGASGDRVCVRRGRIEAGSWRASERGRICFAGDPFARHQSTDLDGDGREELLQIGVRGERRRRLRVTWFAE